MSRNDSNKITPAERAVYELVEAGAIDAAHAGLYRRQLLTLARVGLVVRAEDGGYAPVYATTDKRSRSSPPPRPVASVAPPMPHTPLAEPMQTLVARVPAEIIAALDGIGPTRSDAVRTVLSRALGSGLRKIRAG